MMERIGRTELMIGGAVLAVLLVVTIPLGISMSKKSKRSEVRVNVEAIRKAELDHKRAFGAFIGASAAPRAPHQINAQAVPWVASEGFVKLNWAPEQDVVRGSYTVEATKNGFVVTGSCDIDGDGRRATFTATESGPAELTTDASIY